MAWGFRSIPLPSLGCRLRGLGLRCGCRAREQEKSLWLHRALLAYLLVDPDQAIAYAREQVLRWKRVHRSDGMTGRWLQLWDDVLDRGVESVVDTLTSRSTHALELRANSPFAGLLPDDVRRDVLAAFGRWWRQQGRAA